MFIIRRILIANRGEIAVRVIRTCQRLGIEAVLATSGADADSVPARLADRTIMIGPADAYLSVDGGRRRGGRGGCGRDPSRVRVPGREPAARAGLRGGGDHLRRARRGGAGGGRGQAGGPGARGRGRAAGPAGRSGCGGPAGPADPAGPAARPGRRRWRAGPAHRISGAGQGGRRRRRPGAAGGPRPGCSWLRRSRWPAPRRRRRSGIRGCTWNGTSPPPGTSRCSCSATART